MTIKASTLRPGLLVSCKTSVTGNVRYQKTSIEREHIVEGTAKTQKAKWETERTVADIEEHDAAIRTRSAIRYAISSICANSAFGLLCPETKAEELEQAIAAARKLADEFNTDAKLTRVAVYVITGRIAPDDLEAVRAIKSEVRELLEEMDQGVRNLDPKAIREAASKVRSVGMMLSPDAQARVTVAIEAARTAAKRIVQAGEQAASQVDQSAVRAITEARVAFLDLDDAKPVAAPSEVGRAVDLVPGRRNKAADGYQPDTRTIEVD